MVVGHGSWSCDVVAMAQGGLGCGMAAHGGLMNYGGSVAAGMVTG